MEHFISILTEHAAGKKAILEIGTGHSTNILFKAMHIEGHLTTIDSNANKHAALIQNLSKKYDNRLSVITANSLDVKWAQPLDMLYLDGCHHTEHVHQELNRFGVWVQKGGVIVLDDIRGEPYAPELQYMLARWTFERKLYWDWCRPAPEKLAHVLVNKDLQLFEASHYEGEDPSFCPVRP